MSVETTTDTRHYSVREAASFLKTSTRTVLRLIRDGYLAAHQLRPRGRWLIRARDLFERMHVQGALDCPERRP